MTAAFGATSSDKQVKSGLADGFRAGIFFNLVATHRY
jgi:hypothetical protein